MKDSRYTLTFIKQTKHLGSHFLLASVSSVAKQKRVYLHSDAPSLISEISEPLVGFEPTTPRLQITCSGQLS